MNWGCLVSLFLFAFHSSRNRHCGYFRLLLDASSTQVPERELGSAAVGSFVSFILLLFFSLFRSSLCEYASEPAVDNHCKGTSQVCDASCTGREGVWASSVSPGQKGLYSLLGSYGGHSLWHRPSLSLLVPPPIVRRRKARK